MPEEIDHINMLLSGVKKEENARLERERLENEANDDLAKFGLLDDDLKQEQKERDSLLASKNHFELQMAELEKKFNLAGTK
mmetsp:Transcript_6147/g.8252  ORF Transcript_6147/g.8252 Transcript_6147/m.8252 type:complete len:81 (-) Transcript_6147:242-484(-)